MNILIFDFGTVPAGGTKTASASPERLCQIGIVLPNGGDCISVSGKALWFSLLSFSIQKTEQMAGRQPLQLEPFRQFFNDGALLFDIMAAHAVVSITVRNNSAEELPLAIAIIPSETRGARAGAARLGGSDNEGNPT